MFILKDEQLSFLFREKYIPVAVTYQDRDRLDIKVSPEQKIFVKVPSGKSLSEIKEKISSKSKWILRQLDFFESNPLPQDSDSLKSGSSFRFLGRDYLVIVEQGVLSSVSVRGKFINVTADILSNETTARKTFERWKRQKALEIITPIYDRCFGMIHKYNVEWTPFRLRKMGSRYGSCTPEGVIFLNPDLIAFSEHLIEYAILHELCHLVHPNHGPQFYKLVELMMPDWRDREKDLKAI